eukprot:jgi/Mesen1/2412/ME000157S01553
MLARASQGSWEGLALAAGNKPTGRQAASELQFASPLPPKCSLSSALTLKGSSREGLQPSPHPRRGGELWLERSTSGTSQWAREARAQRSASSPGSSLPSWQSPQKPEPEPEPEPQPGCKYRLMDEEDSAPFTDIYWIQFAHVHNARFAKRKLDDFAFLGNELKVTYAPRDESVGDVRVKLEERRRTVLSKLEGPAGQKLLQQAARRHEPGGVSNRPAALPPAPWNAPTAHISASASAPASAPASAFAPRSPAAAAAAASSLMPLTARPVSMPAFHAHGMPPSLSEPPRQQHLADGGGGFMAPYHLQPVPDAHYLYHNRSLPHLHEQLARRQPLTHDYGPPPGHTHVPQGYQEVPPGVLPSHQVAYIEAPQGPLPPPSLPPPTLPQYFPIPSMNATVQSVRDALDKIGRVAHEAAPGSSAYSQQYSQPHPAQRQHEPGGGDLQEGHVHAHAHYQGGGSHGPHARLSPASEDGHGFGPPIKRACYDNRKRI